MRILLDTNIFIYREEFHVVDKDLTELLQLLNKLKSELVVHPLSIDELTKDGDSKRREINLSKIHAYSILQNPPNYSQDPKFCESLPPVKNSHDQIDNEILYALYKNAVSYLITEDKGIHKKAQMTGISDNVFLISEALEYFNTRLPSKLATIVPPALREEFLYNINLEDPIFDSLREAYDFDKWFRKKAAEERKCYIHERSDGSLGAILIYKFENEIIPTKIPLPQKNRLKISTMKVGHVGYKIGELLLKVAIDQAIKNGIYEIYLTHYTESEDRLVNLISEFGFYSGGILNDSLEDVYLKHLTVGDHDIHDLEPSEISRLYYPSICDGDCVNKFVIPIMPHYHNRLFTGYNKRQTQITEHFGDFSVEGNTIKKVYLTRSNIKKLKPGDIIFFYRSHEEKAITSVGVVDEFYYGVSDLDEITRIIGKRSVYTSDEIENIKKPLSVIIFRHHFHLKNDVPLETAKKSKILSGPPQSIIKLADEKYALLKEIGGIDERFTIN